MLQFLPGIVLIQIITSALVVTAFNWPDDIQLIITIIVITLIFAVLTAFWFSSIAHNIHVNNQTLLLKRHAQDREKILREVEREKANVLKEKSQLQDQHARERERIRLDAEREKAEIIAESYRQIEKQSNKVQARANFKVGIAFATTVGVASVMLFSQLVTIGIMLLLASISGLSGYLLRARQERLSQKKQQLIAKKQS